jgi:GNAT superfamily N-acetyltransferase
MHNLVKELAAYERAPQEVTTNPMIFREDGFGTDPAFEAFVAEIDGDVIGMCLFHTAYSTWKGKYIYLDDLIVREAFRHQGIGKLLFDRLIEHCADINVNQLRWHVLDWNEPAIQFYKKYGASLDSTWITGKLTKQQIETHQAVDESI